MSSGIKDLSALQKKGLWKHPSPRDSSAWLWNWFQPISGIWNPTCFVMLYALKMRNLDFCLLANAFISSLLWLLYLATWDGSSSSLFLGVSIRTVSISTKVGFNLWPLHHHRFLPPISVIDQPYYHGMWLFSFSINRWFWIHASVQANEQNYSVISEFEFLGPSSSWSTMFSQGQLFFWNWIIINGNRRT